MYCPYCNERFDPDIVNEKFWLENMPKYFWVQCPICKEIINIKTKWQPHFKFLG